DHSRERERAERRCRYPREQARDSSAVEVEAFADPRRGDADDGNREALVEEHREDRDHRRALATRSVERIFEVAWNCRRGRGGVVCHQESATSSNTGVREATARNASGGDPALTSKKRWTWDAKRSRNALMISGLSASASSRTRRDCAVAPRRKVTRPAA